MSACPTVSVLRLYGCCHPCHKLSFHPYTIVTGSVSVSLCVCAEVSHSPLKLFTKGPRILGMV